MAIGDNTSAIGWLHNTSRLNPNWKAHAVHLKVARKIAEIVLEREHCIASQHIKGEWNVVADVLSFEGNERGKPNPVAYDNPDDETLTQRIRTTFPSQVPETFAISPLPTNVFCWTVLMLQTAEATLTEDKKGATKEATVPGDDGLGSATNPDTSTIHSSYTYPRQKKTCSSSCSSAPIVTHLGPPTGDLQEIVRNHWSHALSAKPQATWLRRFGSIAGTAPCTSKERKTCAPSSNTT